MPFMKGSAPIRRTANYLKSGKIILRENVKIFSINYNQKGDHHQGARDFVFWHLCQIQFKNPNVQCQTFKNLTPTPFIRIFFEDSRDVIIDIDSRQKDEILEHLVNFSAVCKTKDEIYHEKEISKRSESYCVFGFGCERHCICEIMGQVPCPNLVHLPNCWRGKYSKHFPLQKFQIPPVYMVKELNEKISDE